MAIVRFRRKKPYIEGVQWTGSNEEEVQRFCQPTPFHYLYPEDREDDPDKTAELFVAANNVWVPIATGEWILADSAGYYPCREDIMEQNWERIS